MDTARLYDAGQSNPIFGNDSDWQSFAQNAPHMFMAQELPSTFESLAGLCKFMAVSKISPAFYAKHQHPVEFTCAFIRILANSYPPTEKAFRVALPLTLREGAIPIQAAMSSLGLDKEKLTWFDNQMTEVLRILVPVVRDTDLPGWLSECKWAVEGAFE